MVLRCFLLSFLFAVTAVNALSGGCPVCTLGSAAPLSSHLTRSTIVTGLLSVGNFAFYIDGVAASTTSATQFTVGVNHDCGEGYQR